MAASDISAVDRLRHAWGDVADCLSGLSEDDAWQPTGCTGWSVRDLTFHLLLDAQRALVALGTPRNGQPDTDDVSYWNAWQPDTDRAQTNQRMIRIMASVYPTLARLRDDYAETTQAAAHLAAQADLDDTVGTQGRVLRVADLVRTLVVEAGVHHLDLVVSLDRPGPSAQTLTVVRETLDGLLGRPVPTDWDDVTYARVGTGRQPLSAADRALLGDLAERFPLFG